MKMTLSIRTPSKVVTPATIKAHNYNTQSSGELVTVENI